MARGKPPTELEIERIKILAASGLSDEKIGEKIGRSRSLVRNVLQANAPQAALTKRAFEAESEDDYNAIINLSLTKLLQKVETEEMSAVALAKVMGITFDKRQLLKGGPTVIEESTVNTNESGEAQSVIAAFAEFANELRGEGSEGNWAVASDVVRPIVLAAPTDNQNE